MTREEEIREPVRWFAEKMEAKLRKNDHKGGWLDCDPLWLRMRMEEEMSELHREMVRLQIGRSTPERVVNEAADVANFAMMIADQAREALQPNEDD